MCVSTRVAEDQIFLLNYYSQFEFVFVRLERMKMNVTQNQFTKTWYKKIRRTNINSRVDRRNRDLHPLLLFDLLALNFTFETQNQFSNLNRTIKKFIAIATELGRQPTNKQISSGEY